MLMFGDVSSLWISSLWFLGQQTNHSRSFQHKQAQDEPPNIHLIPSH